MSGRRLMPRRFYRKRRNTSPEMEPIKVQRVTLNNNVEIPIIGVGTWQIRSPDVIMHVVESALAAGYRMFDTAAVYGNENCLGEALRTLLPKFGLTREDIFITTKLSSRHTKSKEGIKEACRKSLSNLGVDYVDVYLIPYPGMGNIASSDPKNLSLQSQAWEALVDLYHEGLTKAIGVSNYTIRQLKELERRNIGVSPAINQVECHPYYPQRELLQYCQANDIHLQTYSSLGDTSSDINKDPAITKIAKDLDASIEQLLLAWAVQQGISVISKSTHSAHIVENISLDFKIPDADMKALAKISKKLN